MESLLLSRPPLWLRLWKQPASSSVRSSGFSSSTPPCCSIMGGAPRPCGKLEVSSYSYANVDTSPSPVLEKKKVPPMELVFCEDDANGSSSHHDLSSSSLLLQTPHCSILDASRCGAGLGNLWVSYDNADDFIELDKKVPMELFNKSAMISVGSSHGWVATLKEDGVLRLQDDLNPAVASDTAPKRIPLPPLVTLPHCQTQIVTNMAMSSPSPEDEDCVVAIKFLGPQLSFCRPAQSSNSEWTNIRIEDPLFFSSHVIYSKKHDAFQIPGSGGHLIGSWDPRTPENKPRFQKLRIKNYPYLTKTQRELLNSCCTSDHLVESRPTGETFLVKWYRKTHRTKSKTKAALVFKVDFAKGNAVYTSDIGDLCIFLSKSEAFCAPSKYPNYVEILDDYETASVSLDPEDFPHLPKVFSITMSLWPAYHIPPQFRELL